MSVPHSCERHVVIDTFLWTLDVQGPYCATSAPPTPCSRGLYAVAQNGSSSSSILSSGDPTWLRTLHSLFRYDFSVQDMQYLEGRALLMDKSRQAIDIPSREEALAELFNNFDDGYQQFLKHQGGTADIEILMCAAHSWIWAFS